MFTRQWSSTYSSIIGISLIFYNFKFLYEILRIAGFKENDISENFLNKSPHLQSSSEARRQRGGSSVYRPEID